MHVLPVNRAGLSQKSPLTSRKAVLVSNKENVSFKSYVSLIDELTKSQIRTEADAQKACKRLIEALKNEGSIVNTKAYNTLMDYNIDSNIRICLRYFSKPINVLSDNVRNIIFESKKENVDIIRINKDNKFLLQNMGQRGFFSCLFDSNNAENDIKLVFTGPNHVMEYGINGDDLYLEQYYDSHWKKTTFDYFGKIKKCESGLYDGVFVPPPI